MALWFQQHSLPCPVKKYVHISCPGCGLQTSWVQLLLGNFSESFRCHPATIPLLLYLLFAVAHLLFKFKNGNKIIIAGYLLIVCIVITNYIYKIIH